MGHEELTLRHACQVSAQSSTQREWEASERRQGTAAVRERGIAVCSLSGHITGRCADGVPSSAQPSTYCPMFSLPSSRVPCSGAGPACRLSLRTLARGPAVTYSAPRIAGPQCLQTARSQQQQLSERERERERGIAAQQCYRALGHITYAASVATAWLNRWGCQGHNSSIHVHSLRWLHPRRRTAQSEAGRGTF